MFRRLLTPSVVAVTMVMVAVATWRDARPQPQVLRPVVSPIDLTTRDELQATVDRTEQRLAAKPTATRSCDSLRR